MMICGRASDERRPMHSLPGSATRWADDFTPLRLSFLSNKKMGWIWKLPESFQCWYSDIRQPFLLLDTQRYKKALFLSTLRPGNSWGFEGDLGLAPGPWHTELPLLGPVSSSVTCGDWQCLGVLRLVRSLCLAGFFNPQKEHDERI